MTGAGEGDETLRGGIAKKSRGRAETTTCSRRRGDLIQSFDGGTDEIYGEEGNDTITFDQSSSNASTGSFVSGGVGDDKITIRFSADGGVATFDAGEGADLVTLGYVYETTISVTLGAGIDRLRLEPGVTSYFGSTVIEDFAPEAGETIDWLSYIAGSFLTGTGANPFGNGMVRLIQDARHAMQVVTIGVAGIPEITPPSSPSERRRVAVHGGDDGRICPDERSRSAEPHRHGG